jgi:hypothetical protein
MNMFIFEQDISFVKKTIAHKKNKTPNPGFILIQVLPWATQQTVGQIGAWERG